MRFSKNDLCCIQFQSYPRKILFLQPKVVTDTDEAEFSKQLAQLEKMNAEVAGDDSADEMPNDDEDEPEQ